MTLEEAKKILEKEGFVVERFLGVLVEDVKTASWEKIEVSEAMRVVVENGYLALMEESKYKERKARLKKECENNTKAPVFGEVEAGDSYLKKATDAFILQANEIMRLKKKNAELLEAIDNMKEGSPALAESASQFNDALLDEQAKKIKRLGKEIARLNGIIHDKNAILSDVAEELRLSKIREKNLTEVGQKYMKEVEDLREKLADKVGNGIDWKRNADAIQLYVNRASHERLWNPINQDICNEKELSFIINHGGKRVKYALRFDGTDIVYECSDPDKKPRIPTPEEPKHGNSLKDFISKTIDNYNRRAANLGCIGSKDGNGIFYQMVGVDIAEEGGDQSATIVQCGNGITISKEEAEIIERCTKNGTELHYSEKDGFTYTNVFGKEMPIRCLRGMFHVFTDEEIENMRK